MTHLLTQNLTIVHNNPFKMAVIEILNVHKLDMNYDERHALQTFKIEKLSSGNDGAYNFSFQEQI